MVTCTDLRGDRRRFLALTGLTPAEFDRLLPVFDRRCERFYFAERTLAGRPHQRFPGGGRIGKLYPPEQKLLFLLVYLKTYPLQVLMAELFGMSQPRVHYWLHRLLPVLREALEELGALPERNPRAFARRRAPRRGPVRRIVDGCERRRQRPKNPEKQAAHYSGRKKTHCDKNLVEAGANLDTKDTAWHGTPLGWAEHYIHEAKGDDARKPYAEIAAHLRAKAGER